MDQTGRPETPRRPNSTHVDRLYYLIPPLVPPPFFLPLSARETFFPSSLVPFAPNQDDNAEGDFSEQEPKNHESPPEDNVRTVTCNLIFTHGPNRRPGSVRRGNSVQIPPKTCQPPPSIFSAKDATRCAETSNALKESVCHCSRRRQRQPRKRRPGEPKALHSERQPPRAGPRLT